MKLKTPAQFFLAFIGLSLLSTVAFALEIGKLNKAFRPVPEFKLEGYVADPAASETWTPESFAGKAVIINFWATWCAPCRAEMPSLNRGWQKVKDQDVLMLGINLGDKPADIERFLKEVPVDFPIAMSTNPSDLATWGVRGLPTTIVVDKNGVIVLELVGPAEWDDDELLDPVLALAEPE